MGYDDVAGAAQAALREGRVSDIAPDPENGRLLCEVADELGGKQTVSLPFAAWSEKGAAWPRLSSISIPRSSLSSGTASSARICRVCSIDTP